MAGGDAPYEYLELTLCRDVYHCTPQELAEVPLDKVLAHLACMSVETQVRRQQDKVADNV